MHIYFIGRGISKWLRRFEEDILTQYATMPDGSQLQLGLREVRLYELAFPKEAEQSVTNLLGNSQDMGKWNKYKNLLRKALGLRNCIPTNSKDKSIDRLHVGVHTIGVKDDRENEDGSEHI